MSNLISKNELKQEIEKWYAMKHSNLDSASHDILIKIIDEFSSVEPERKTGKWIPVYDDNGRCCDFRCSACNGADEYGSKFCPNCGAKMEASK